MIDKWLKSKSIVYKTRVIILLAFLSTAAIFFVARDEVLNTMMIVELDEHGNELRQKSARLKELVQSLTDDVRHLSLSRPVIKLNAELLSPNTDLEKLKEAVVYEFVAMMKSKKYFRQLQIISADADGKEVIRVTRDRFGVIKVAEESQLQLKGQSSYFKASSSLHSGEVYLSPVQLNREKGEVEVPHRPVIRAIIPLLNNSGETVSVIVCNMDFKEVLGWLVESHGDGFDYILNVNGDYLSHPDKTKTFGFEFGSTYTFQDEFPELKNLISNRGLGIDNKTYEYLNGDVGIAAIRMRFDPLTTANDILMVRVIPYHAISAQAAAAISQTLWLVLILFLIGSILARKFTQTLVDPIRTLTKSTDAIIKGEATRIPDLDFGGEMAALANDFNEVLETLELRKSELNESYKWNAVIMKSSYDGIVSIDEEGIILSLNESAQIIFGYTSAEAVGHNVNILMPSQYHDSHQKYFTEYTKGDTHTKEKVSERLSKTLEMEAQRKGGVCFPIEVNVTVAQLGNKTRYIATLRDITTRKNAEEQLKLSEARLREAQHIANLGSWDWDLIENKLDWSLEVYRIFGISPEKFGTSYEFFMSRVHPEDREKVQHAVNATLESGEPYDINHRICMTDGTVRWVNERGKLYQADDGSASSMVGTVRDITKHQEYEDELRKSESRYREVVEGSPYPIVVYDHESMVYVNKAALNFFGANDPSTIIGKGFLQFIHPDFHKNASSKMSRLLNGERTPEEREYVLFKLNGEEAKVRITSILVEFDGQDRVLTQFRDITEEERVKQKLKEEYLLNEQILGAIPSILIGVDQKGDIALWNHMAETTFGIRSGDALGTSLHKLNINWSWKEIDHGIVNSRATGTARIDHVTFSRTDGSDGVLGLTINTIYNKGVDEGLLLLGSEISERLKLEGQLLLAQKMEAVGELAAGIAHEINTPLQYVGDNIRFLKDSFQEMQILNENYHKLIDHCDEKGFALDLVKELKKADDDADLEFIMEEIPPAVDQSLEGIAKASYIVGAMKEFSHPGQKEKVLCDINRILESTTTVAKNEWKYVAELKLELDDELPPVCCLPEINQVFLNMIVNAAHSIAEKLGENSPEKGLIRIQTAHSDHQFVEVRISDSGCGIPEEIRNKIFEPFFTTKEVGKGTGQGLAISHSIVVDLHKGALDIESEVGKGTTFIIKLPLTGQEVS